ncbi:hypothetical protein ACIRU8_28250 [Streptomyces sp. NPDC101175]|uniref:hypothetical protein n=1 Tax=Streptomyces sp. NPDC101175 TaxID=3366123 RepID=UPI0038327F86
MTPQTAITDYSCGTFGLSFADLTATQTGNLATITIAFHQISAPVSIPPSSIHSKLTLTDTNTYGTRIFEGDANPDLWAGDHLTVGPLPGIVLPGDSLDTYGASLSMVIYGITITCTPLQSLSPSPFVFD